MSSVSSVGGNAQSLYQFIQSLSGTTASQSTGATSGTAASPTSNSATQTIAQAAQSIGQALQGGQHHHHHHGGGLQQIQDAVTNALQSAQSNGSTSDPNKIVEDAISQVLGNNNAAVSSTTSGTAAAASGTTSTSAAANTQAFFQTLQSFGVSPQQFQQDLLSAVKDAQNGTVNSSTAFQNFPVGSALDTIG